MLWFILKLHSKVKLRLSEMLYNSIKKIRNLIFNVANITFQENSINATTKECTSASSAGKTCSVPKLNMILAADGLPSTTCWPKKKWLSTKTPARVRLTLKKKHIFTTLTSLPRAHKNEIKLLILTNRLQHFYFILLSLH